MIKELQRANKILESENSNLAERLAAKKDQYKMEFKTEALE